MCGTGQAGVSGAGQAVGVIFCLVSWPSTEQERLTVPVPVLASRAEVTGDKCLAVPWGWLPGLSLWLCPARTVPQGLSRELWAWSQHLTKEETSPVSSFIAHFTHHLVSWRHLSAQALENAAHGRPAALLVLFLLSLLRQGSIKRVFALLKPRITPHLLKVFSAGLGRSSPPPLCWSCFKACRSLPCRSLPCVPHRQSRCFPVLGVCRGGCSPSSARTS